MSQSKKALEIEPTRDESNLDLSTFETTPNSTPSAPKR